MKITSLIPMLAVTFAVGLVSMPAKAQNAPVSVTINAESSIQYSATLDTGFTNYVGSATGPYDKVKYSATTPCKTYFKFDFTGQTPNTNYLLKFSLTHASSAGATHLQLWALNQAYPGFVPLGSGASPTASNPSLSFAGAQANNPCTSCNDMLTSGTYTATLINDFIDSTVSLGSTLGFSIPAPWAQYLQNNQVVIVLTSTNDPGVNNSNGDRFQLGVSTATFQPLTTGTLPPTISPIADLSMRSGTSSGNIAFTVSDPQDAASALTNINVSLANTNVTLTSTNITIGSGGNRTLSFTAVNNLAPGTTANVTVTVAVTDSRGNSASSAFLLTVTPFVNLPMVLSGTNVNYLLPTNRVGVGSVIIPFQVVDTNVAASSLVITGAVSAYSTNLGSISFTSTASVPPNTNDCTLTVTATGSGVGIVNLNIIDPVHGVSNTAVSLAVMVLPDGTYAVCDRMNYTPSTSYSASSGHSDLFDASADLWAARTVNQSVNLITTVTPSSTMPIGVPLIRGSASGNQNQLRLAGAPYAAGSHKVLYASVRAQWCDVSLYGANYYYPGNSTGGFVEFAEDANNTGVTMASVCTITNAANTATNSGTFYLALYNSTNAPSVFTGYQENILDASTGGLDPVVNIATSYDVDTGISQLWVNQSSSAGTSVSLQDVAVTNLAGVSYLVLRQNAQMGQILIESAAVKVVTKPIPTITGMTAPSGGNVQIYFTCAPGSGGTASVVGSSTVNGTYTTVGGVSISEPTSGNFVATVPVSGTKGFYRIKQTATLGPVSFPF